MYKIEKIKIRITLKIKTDIYFETNDYMRHRNLFGSKEILRNNIITLI